MRTNHNSKSHTRNSRTEFTTARSDRQRVEGASQPGAASAGTHRAPGADATEGEAARTAISLPPTITSLPSTSGAVTMRTTAVEPAHRAVDAGGTTSPAAGLASGPATATRHLQVHNETGRLRSVVIGLPDTFELPPPINRKHEIFHADHPERPTQSKLIPEFAAFRSVLEARGVEVLQPRPVPGVPDQLTPRDIGFVLGDTFVVSNMRTECRRHEWKGIEHLIDEMPEDRVVWVPDDVTVEGGDIILDRGTLYIGLSERTSIEGAEWLREHYAWRYRVQLVPLKELHHGEDVLHMDCTFLPVGEHHCLIYPDGFHQIPKCVRANYEWIEITKEEQFELATNVLSISPTEVISRHSSTRINNRLRELGFEVIEVKFDETPKGGGSFRCSSLPLYREDGD